MVPVLFYTEESSGGTLLEVFVDARKIRDMSQATIQPPLRLSLTFREDYHGVILSRCPHCVSIGDIYRSQI